MPQASVNRGSAATFCQFSRYRRNKARRMPLPVRASVLGEPLCRRSNLLRCRAWRNIGATPGRCAGSHKRPAFPERKPVSGQCRIALIAWPITLKRGIERPPTINPAILKMSIALI
jgi:hypothetical protein